MRERTVAFVRQSGWRVENVCILRVMTELTSNEDVMRSLMRAVTHWVKVTEVGMDCWKASSEDLNIGDLEACGAFEDADLLAFMRERGVEYVGSWLGSPVASESYDKVLVDIDCLEELD